MEAQTRRIKFEQQFRYSDQNRTRITLGQDLRRYLDLLNEENTADQVLMNMVHIARGAEVAVAQGKRDLAEIEKSEASRRTRNSRPDKQEGTNELVSHGARVNQHGTVESLRPEMSALLRA